MLIDSHVHIAPRLTGFWKPLRYGKATWNGTTKQLFPPSFDPAASPPDILLAYMDMVGVDRAIVVQHNVYGDHNSTVVEMLKQWPDRFTGFAFMGKLDQPDAPDLLESWIEKGIAGLKIELLTTRTLRGDFRFDGEREWRVFERLNRLGRPLILDINDATREDVTALRKVLDAFPRMPVVICHLGGPLEGYEERALLAKRANGWVDLTSLFYGAGPEEEEYPFPRAQELIRWAVGQFGADRMMLGSDYPYTLNRATYQQLFDYVRRHCSFLSPEQKAAILGGTAEQFLKSWS